MPRGSKTGTQGVKGKKERAIIPAQLCEHIVEICEEENPKRPDQGIKFLTIFDYL